jgi:hypothetical protein
MLFTKESNDSMISSSYCCHSKKDDFNSFRPVIQSMSRTVEVVHDDFHSDGVDAVDGDDDDVQDELFRQPELSLSLQTVQLLFEVADKNTHWPSFSHSYSFPGI